MTKFLRDLLESQPQNKLLLRRRYVMLTFLDFRTLFSNFTHTNKQQVLHTLTLMWEGLDSFLVAKVIICKQSWAIMNDFHLGL